MTIITTLNIEPYTVLEDYDPKDEKKISSAFSYIKQKLVKIENDDEIEESLTEDTYHLSTLAISYIKELSHEIQEQYREIQNLLMEQLQDQEYQKKLSLSDKRKSIQKRLFHIFSRKNDSTFDSLSPHINLEPDDEDQFHQEIVETYYQTPSITTEKNDSLTDETLERKKKQVKFVADFGRRFMRDYYPHIILRKESSPRDQYLQYALEQFTETLPAAIPHILFHATKILEKHEKQMIISVLKQVINFFSVYNLSMETIKQSDKLFEEKRLVDKEAIILTQMNTLLTEQNELSFIPESLNEAEFTINLSKIFKLLILQYYKITDPKGETVSPSVQQFTASTIPLFVVPIFFQRILSPYLFCVLFDSLLLKDIDIPEGYVEGTPLKQCDASDAIFTQQVGLLAEQLTGEILRFGEAKGIIKGVKLIVSKDSIGELIQKGINHILGTDTCFLPIAILNSLLYHQGRPILLEAFNLDDEKSTAYMKSVEKNVQSRIYEILMKRLPKFLAFATDNLTSLDSFCETLSTRIFELTQSKKLFILFSCYILHGFKEGLSTQRNCNEPATR
jgi:hypothetical protein